MGEGWCSVFPNDLVFTFGGFYVCANFDKSPSINASMGCKQTGTWREANWFYNLSCAICYSCGQIIKRWTGFFGHCVLLVCVDSYTFYLCIRYMYYVIHRLYIITGPPSIVLLAGICRRRL